MEVSRRYPPVQWTEVLEFIEAEIILNKRLAGGECAQNGLFSHPGFAVLHYNALMQATVDIIELYSYECALEGRWGAIQLTLVRSLCPNPFALLLTARNVRAGPTGNLFGHL